MLDQWGREVTIGGQGLGAGEEVEGLVRCAGRFGWLYRGHPWRAPVGTGRREGHRGRAQEAGTAGVEGVQRHVVSPPRSRRAFWAAQRRQRAGTVHGPRHSEDTPPPRAAAAHGLRMWSRWCARSSVVAVSG